MNVLEFTQLKNDDIKCRYTSKNGNRKILSTRNSIVLLKGLNKILSNEKCTIIEKRGKVFLTTSTQSICLHDYEEFRYDLKRYIPNVVKQIDKAMMRQRIISIKRSALTATAIASIVCTGLLINPTTVNSIDKQQTFIEMPLERENIQNIYDDSYIDKVPTTETVNNDEETVIEETVDNTNTTPTYNYEVNINCPENATDPEIIAIQETYREIANKVGTKWGVSPNLLLAMLTQESHGAYSNLMQIQDWSHKDEVMEVYNFNTNQMQKIVVTDNPGKYASDVITITKADLDNPFTNISVAAIIYRNIFNTYGKQNPIASIEIYNKGIGNFNKSMNKMYNDTGLTKEEVLATLDNTDFLNYSYVSGQGDPNYVANVLQYLNGDITITIIGDDNQLYNVTCTVNKTQEKELSR